ncbi:MAG: hypothetical protein EOP10_27950 [Proteobacteria bacterium]|nr:MAG: hypothetical protein EOP10_27950 [Pseudomonadota bacterium]
MQKTSLKTFDPFANERLSSLELLSQAWRKTSRIWSKTTLRDEIEYDLKRLESRMGVSVLAAKSTISGMKSSAISR